MKLLKLIISGAMLTGTVLFAAPQADIKAKKTVVKEQTIQDFKNFEKKNIALIEKLTKATVGIMVLGKPSMGSGVIVSKDGLIMSAAHVLSEPNAELMIFLSDGRRLKGKALGLDKTKDAGMAKIIVEGEYDFVEIGKSSDLKTGDWCIALGHPGGIQRKRKPPVRLGRLLQVGKGNTMQSGLMSDCTVISGDSGGPLFDVNGKLIGIHSNIGFQVTQNRHVPIDVITKEKAFYMSAKVRGKSSGQPFKGGRNRGGVNQSQLQKFQQLLRQKMAQRDPEVMDLVRRSGGRLQLTPQKMAELVKKWEGGSTASASTRRGLFGVLVDKTAKNARVKKVGKDTAAEDAGLKINDVITHLGNKQIKNATDVAEFMKTTKPGQRLNVKYLRDGKVVDKRITLQRGPEIKKPAVTKAPTNRRQMNLKGLDPKLAAKLKKYMVRGADGRMQLRVTPQNRAELLPLIQEMNKARGVKMPGFGDVAKSKTNKQILKKFTTVP